MQPDRTRFTTKHQDVTLQTLSKRPGKRHQNKFLFQHPPTTGAYFWEPFSACKKPVRLETSCWRVRHRRYDVIDLDPYGTVSPFIDAAVQVRPGFLGCWGGVEVNGGVSRIAEVRVSLKYWALGKRVEKKLKAALAVCSDLVCKIGRNASGFWGALKPLEHHQTLVKIIQNHPNPSKIT